MAADYGPMSFGLDRRRYVRIGFDCPIRWSVDGTERSGWARDASEGGAAITVPAGGAPKVGETVSVTFQLDNYCDWPVSSKARVAWRQDTDNGMCHLGLRIPVSQTATRRRLAAC